MIGGFGSYFFNHEDKVSVKYKLEEKNTLTGTLKLKINDILYLPIGRVEAFDNNEKSYEIFYNSIEGTASIKELDKMASGDKINKSVK